MPILPRYIPLVALVELLPVMLSDGWVEEDVGSGRSALALRLLPAMQRRKHLGTSFLTPGVRAHRRRCDETRSMPDTVIVGIRGLERSSRCQAHSYTAQNCVLTVCGYTCYLQNCGPPWSPLLQATPMF